MLLTPEAPRKCSYSSAYLEGAVICIIFLETLVSCCVRGDDTAGITATALPLPCHGLNKQKVFTLSRLRSVGWN